MFGVSTKVGQSQCAQCIYEGGGWLCEACAKSHECGEEMLLPVVNSPRVGTWGYTGPAEWSGRCVTLMTMTPRQA